MHKFFVFLTLFIFIPITVNALITENVTNGCDTDLLGLSNNVVIEAVFEIASYTCSAGQYLPIAATGCVACPNEATCSGGTFYFNENRSQGIVYNNPFNQDKVKGCENNLLGVSGNVVIEAVFEPKNVTINWDDGNGNTTATTCNYDGLINLPAEPTRPGYTFSGWKLDTNNE